MTDTLTLLCLSRHMWSYLKWCWSGADWRYLLIEGRIRNSNTFAAGQKSEISRYKVPIRWFYVRYASSGGCCVCPALLFLQLLIDILTGSVVNECTISLFPLLLIGSHFPALLDHNLIIKNCKLKSKKSIILLIKKKLSKKWSTHNSCWCSCQPWASDIL